MKKFKKLILMVIVTVSIIPFFAKAQEGNYKHPIMSIDSKGKIERGGVVIGQITKDNVINDAKGNKIAYVDGQGNLVDAKGKLMGRRGKDGKTYHNVNGDLTISVKDNGKTCNVFDGNGDKIGNIHSSYKGMACVLYCFQNDMVMKDHSKMKDAKYACPMHPEVTGMEGDKCHKCGMKLTKASKK
ncbi:heavy metal-binding domain-containing protein [Lacihabitans soyangensis]|uniref:heavy metal-binding domain-containing protein n=1 Tax=Lacihabitans soyangensis TaxID=869394 RepID=UPI00286DFA02|nr:heavy metal-binding domain-containing protein [Lacihabitans soyangensis]